MNHGLLLQWFRSRSWGRDKLHLVFNIMNIANWRVLSSLFMPNKVLLFKMYFKILGNN